MGSLRQDYTYDSLNRLTGLTNSVGGSFAYTLRADGKRLSVTDSTGTTQYQYDPDGRLTQEAGPYGSIAYAYDSVGNRLSKTVSNATGSLVSGTTSYAYDADDRLMGESGPGGTVSHTYDADGNETTVNGQSASYDWDNKLVGLGSSASNLYDADGNRVGATAGGATTDFLVDTTLGFPSVVAEYVNGSSTPSATYVYGDDLISTTQGRGTSYYVFDGLGSTRALTGAGGAVKDRDDNQQNVRQITNGDKEAIAQTQDGEN